MGAAVEGVELSLVKNWQAFISSLTGHCSVSCSCPRDPILLISFCFPFENQRNPVKNSRGGTFFHSQLQDLFFRKFFGIFQDTFLLKFCTLEILFPVEFSSLLKSFNILSPNFRKFFFRNSSLKDQHPIILRFFDILLPSFIFIFLPKLSNIFRTIKSFLS